MQFVQEWVEASTFKLDNFCEFPFTVLRFAGCVTS